MAKNHQTDNPLYKALEKKYESDIASAKATMIIYFDNPVAIGEHPQHKAELDKLTEQPVSYTHLTLPTILLV